MAVEIGSAYFTLLPSMAGTAASVQAQLAGQSAALSGAGSVAGTALGGGILASAKRAILPIGAAVTAVFGGSAIVGAVSDFIGQSIDAASNLNESLNAIKATYGGLSTEIDRLGETSAQRLGLSQRAFNEIAVRFSAFATRIAGSGGDVVGVIDQLSQRGSDFASVYNLEVEEALRLFQSGLAGETEPLRRYGIDLSAASVAAYAYANGIAQAGEELTETQKIQARYQYLLEQTAATEGDFANTQDELANSQRTLNAEWENALADLGTSLLPTATEFVNFLRTEGIPVVQQIADVLREWGPTITNTARVFFGAMSLMSTALGILQLALRPVTDGIANFLRLLGGVVSLGTQVAFPRVTTSGKTTTITRAATGAVVPAQPGGAFLNVGEGNSDEVVLPLTSSVLGEIGEAIGGARGQTELGPRTLATLVEAMTAQRYLEADGRVIAATAQQGSAKLAAIGAG